MKHGRISRVDEDFLEEMEDIKLERIKKGIERGMISDRRITNAIARHPKWKEIKSDIIRAKPVKRGRI